MQIDKTNATEENSFISLTTRAAFRKKTPLPSEKAHPNTEMSCKYRQHSQIHEAIWLSCLNLQDVFCCNCLCFTSILNTHFQLVTDALWLSFTHSTYCTTKHISRSKSVCLLPLSPLFWILCLSLTIYLQTKQLQNHRVLLYCIHVCVKTDLLLLTICYLFDQLNTVLIIHLCLCVYIWIQTQLLHPA